jgi:hypothetical protein
MPKIAPGVLLKYLFIKINVNKNIKIIAIQTKGFEESNGASEASVETVSSNIIAFKSAFIFKTLKVFQ